MSVLVLTRAQLLAHLGSRRRVDRALVAGDWQRVLRGAYVPRGVPLNLEVKARAARLLLPDHAVVADRCLLWLLGVDVLPPGAPTLEVVVPRDAVVPRRSGLTARVAFLPPGDLTVPGSTDVPCLRTGRAVADLLRLLPPMEAVVVADAVQQERLLDADALQIELAAHTGLRGVRLAHRALELSDPRAGSPQESRVRYLLVQAGLVPVPQYEVRDSAGQFVARVDLAFPAVRLAIEYDGRAVHEREDVFVHDRRRQNALVREGWTVLRFTAADLRHPAVLISQVRAQLAAAAA